MWAHLCLFYIMSCNRIPHYSFIAQIFPALASGSSSCVPLICPHSLSFFFFFKLNVVNPLTFTECSFVF